MQLDSKKGEIWLVGAGPGSASLLTLAAKEVIDRADLVLVDKLVPEDVTRLIPASARVVVSAPKFKGNAQVAQDLLVEEGLVALRKGQCVVRLKQGDPFVFGRGGEEITAFRKHGFDPHVIPGVCSALAAPIYADVPTTHRNIADSIYICTATTAKNSISELPQFRDRTTFIFLMALHKLPSLVDELITMANFPPTVPCAAVERASMPDGRTIRAQLDGIVQALEENAPARPPGLLIVGNACSIFDPAKFLSV